eukprot:359531-Prorocentrum_minimum.AAC.1
MHKNTYGGCCFSYEFQFHLNRGRTVPCAECGLNKCVHHSGAHNTPDALRLKPYTVDAFEDEAATYKEQLAELFCLGDEGDCYCPTRPLLGVFPVVGVRDMDQGCRGSDS